MRIYLRWLPVMMLCCAPAADLRADEPNLRLRIEWGGGDSPQQWQGELRLSQGEFSKIAPLGMEADTPGSIGFTPLAGDAVADILAQGTLHVWQRSPRSYDGIDVLVDAPLTATLEISLSPEGGGPPPSSLQVPLSELVDGDFKTDLDNSGHRLVVRRAPGDALRVLYDRQSLVFDPGEVFTFRVDPHHTGLAVDEALRLHVALVPARGTNEIEHTEHALPVTPEGDWTPIAQTIVLPSTEGAYDLVLTVEKRQRFLPATVLLRRRLQVVVIDQNIATEAVPALEEVVAELEPANPDFWERFRQIPQLRRIPGLRNEPLGNDRSRAFTHRQDRWIEIDPGGWVAYPLPITETGQLHILEIEYPNDLPQTLGISIIEPNAAGEIVPPSVDSAVDVPPAPSGTAPGTARHRLYFWPRSESPLVLLTNRRPDQRAYFGRIRILTGPARLASASPPQQFSAGRQVLAYFDQPHYPELFSASEALDRTTNRSLDDWKTFLDGGNRLTEYLAHAGYGGAMIAATCDGSALYPSELLQPTPKYDMGTFFSDGPDATRKDVLELLFRQFDRSGQVLVPIVQFSAPLPRLESKLRQPGAEGIELVNPHGRRWLDENPMQPGQAPYYNPLDPRVQQAMTEVLEELVRRYGDHASFGGISLQLSDDGGYAILPGPQWGCDDATLARFVRDTGLQLPGDGWLTPELRMQFLLGMHLDPWQAWRAEELTAFYERLSQVVRNTHPRARLYLSGSRLIDSLDSRLSLRPTLPHTTTTTSALLALGLDVQRLDQLENVVFMRPRYYSPLASVTERGPSIEVNRDTTFDAALTGSSSAAATFHAVNRLSLPEFDNANPFGANVSYTVLMPIATPSGSWNRRRFVESLAARDVALLADGGWTIPLGQEAALTDLLVTLRRLPAEQFETPPDAQAAPLVVRTLRQNDRSYVYLLNNSRWNCTAELQVNAPAGTRFVSLHADNRQGALNGQAGELKWTIELAPYDMVAGYFTQPEADVTSATVTLPRGAALDLAKQVQELGRQLGAIPNVPPWPVPNSGFEAAAGLQDIPGWKLGRAVGVDIRLDPLQKQAGTQSLRIESSSPTVWVRSAPLDIPNTGRISVRAWLRIDNPAVQPQLRLAIEGSRHGRPYYRYAEVGAGQPVQLTQQWKPYELRIYDLPPEGLDDLRVGFDLMGKGQVWIDTVEVFHLPLSGNEPFELAKLAALADLKLTQGNVAECAEVLDGYWPQFLNDNEQLDQQLLAAQPAAIVPRAPAEERPEEDEDLPLWQRFRAPRLPWF